MTAAMTPRDRAARLVALRVVSDWIRAEDRKLREDAAAEMVVGERVSGALPDGELLGFVQLTKARESAVVVDQAALLAWAKAVAPTEVVTTEAVNTAFLNSVLADVKSHGGWISPAGELLDVEGVEVRTGSPVLTVKAAAEADELVRSALAARRLELNPPAA